MKTEDVRKYQEQEDAKSSMPRLVEGTQIIVDKPAIVLIVGVAEQGDQLALVQYSDGTVEWVELSKIRIVS